MLPQDPHIWCWLPQGVLWPALSALSFSRGRPCRRRSLVFGVFRGAPAGSSTPESPPAPGPAPVRWSVLCGDWSAVSLSTVCYGFSSLLRIYEIRPFCVAEVNERRRVRGNIVISWRSNIDRLLRSGFSVQGFSTLTVERSFSIESWQRPARPSLGVPPPPSSTCTAAHSSRMICAARTT